MASTRNLNTKTNYKQEQIKTETSKNYLLNSENIINPSFAGFGFNPSKMVLNTLSSNSVDVESYLFGINSTNLTIANSNNSYFTPEMNYLSTKSLVEENKEVIMPKPFYENKKERPLIN